MCVRVRNLEELVLIKMACRVSVCVCVCVATKDFFFCRGPFIYGLDDLTVEVLCGMHLNSSSKKIIQTKLKAAKCVFVCLRLLG